MGNKGFGEGSKETQFKKGYTPWNYKDGKRAKRKWKRFNGKLVHNSHYVWLTYNNLKEIPKGYVIHHKDGDSLNDNIENLILMTDKEHKQLQKKGKELIDSPLTRESVRERRKGESVGLHVDNLELPEDTEPVEKGTIAGAPSGSGDVCECGDKKDHHFDLKTFGDNLGNCYKCKCKKFTPKKEVER